MLTTGRKLTLSLTCLVLSVLLLRVSGWFGVGFPIGLLLSILYWIDLGRELRAKPPTNRALRVLGLVMGVPQALLGFVCVAAGAAIICWVIYNSLWQRDPHYSGGFLTFGIGPVLMLVGVAWLIDAFRKPPKRLDESLAIEFDEREVRVVVIEGLETAWNQSFAWEDIERVCFQDAGLYRSDVLLITLKGREKPVVILTEAKGGPALIGALADKGYFPEQVWRRAVGETSGGRHCWPPETNEA